MPAGRARAGLLRGAEGRLLPERDDAHGGREAGDGSRRRTEGGAKDGGAAKLAIDGDPQTGWCGAGKVGRAKQAVFNLSKPLDGRSATLELVFERYYAASLGRFRISVADRGRDR